MIRLLQCAVVIEGKQGGKEDLLVEVARNVIPARTALYFRLVEALSTNSTPSSTLDSVGCLWASMCGNMQSQRKPYLHQPL